MNAAEPLKFPTPWPPPDPPQPTRREQWFEAIPVVGWCTRARRNSSWWHTLYAIEKQIIDQFIDRECLDAWPEDSLRGRIVRILETVVATEKSLPRVSLHAKDPLCLVFWGPYDDLSGLLFVQKTHQQFGPTFSREDFWDLLSRNTTVADLLDRCVRNLATLGLWDDVLDGSPVGHTKTLD